MSSSDEKVPKSQVFRDRAEEYRVLANSFRNEQMRALLFSVAADYDRMADQAVHDEGVREDNLDQFLNGQNRRRFGELIAWAAGHKAEGYHGPWPPGPYRTNR